MKSNAFTRFLLRTLVITGMLIISLGAMNALASGSTGGDAYLGVYTQHYDKMLQEDIGYNGNGVYVKKVERRSPASEAGLDSGDIILKVGKKEIHNRKSLQRALWKMEPGDDVKITVWRDGKKVEIKATLGRRSEGYKLASGEYHRHNERARAEYYRDLARNGVTVVSPSIPVPDDLDEPIILSRPDLPNAADRARATRNAKKALRELSARPIEAPVFSEHGAIWDLRDGSHYFRVQGESKNDRRALD